MVGESRTSGDTSQGIGHSSVESEFEEVSNELALQKTGSVSTDHAPSAVPQPDIAQDNIVTHSIKKDTDEDPQMKRLRTMQLDDLPSSADLPGPDPGLEVSPLSGQDSSIFAAARGVPLREEIRLELTGVPGHPDIDDVPLVSEPVAETVPDFDDGTDEEAVVQNSEDIK